MPTLLPPTLSKLHLEPSQIYRKTDELHCSPHLITDDVKKKKIKKSFAFCNIYLYLDKRLQSGFCPGWSRW